MNAEASRPIDVDLTWLSSELSSLSKVRAIADGALLHHYHGVIYAVKIATIDLDTLDLHSTMGIKSRSRIAPSKIVGKVVVPGNYVHQLAGRCIEEFDKLEAFTQGIYATLSKRKSR